MKFPESLGLTGGLYAATKEDHDAWTELPGVTVEKASPSRWLKLHLDSPTPLTSNEAPQVHYHYYFLVRPSGPRFLLVSSHAGLDEQLILRSKGRIAAVRPTIDIPKLVNELTHTPGRYVISALWARVEGFGQTLRSMSLFGTDLAASSLFTEILPLLVAHRVQLRDVSTRTDALSIASRGEVGFQYSGLRSLRAVDQTLSFLSSHHHIEWSISEPVEASQ
jgi:hypothetical protein